MAPLNHSHVDLEAANGVDNNLNTVSLQLSDGVELQQQLIREENRVLSICAPQISEIVDKRRVPSSSSSSECSVMVDLQDSKLHLIKNETDCRICHLSLDSSNLESGIPIQLGCSCKDDLAAAHKQCAEAWFKIKGDIICEICGSTALNVEVVSGGNEVVTVVEQWNEPPTGAVVAPVRSQPECRKFWQGHRFLNFVLACVVFAFVISWLFHFNVPS